MKHLTGGIIKSNSNKFASIYRGIDMLIIIAFLLLASVFYYQSFETKHLILSTFAALWFTLIAEAFSLYRSWRAGTLKEMTFYTLLSWSISVSVLVLALFFFKMSESYSRLVLGTWFVSVASSLLIWRYVFQSALSYFRKKGYNTRSIALFSLSKKGLLLAQQAQENPETGYRLKAIFDDRDITRLNANYHSLVHGDVAKGIEAARNNQFDVIYIALPIKSQDRIQSMLSELGDTSARVHVVPDSFMYSLMHCEMSHLGEVQTISVFDNPISGGFAAVKRLEDIVLSCSALLLLCLPMFVIALMIKFSSPGPIFFKQNRSGINGRQIKVWKFRTMKVMENNKEVIQASKDDPRITALGAFLRKYSLDELPQFINALKGDMSVIGPRPHAIAHNEVYRKIVSDYMLRHRVKPGITGWAQVNGWRGETDTLTKMQKRVEYDLEYIRNWSLWMDFKIIIYTFMRSFTDKNAY